MNDKLVRIRLCIMLVHDALTLEQTRDEKPLKTMSIIKENGIYRSAKCMQLSKTSGLLCVLFAVAPSSLLAAVSQPASVTGQVSGTTVTLDWPDANAEEAVEGYNIYRDNQYLTTVLESEYTGTVAQDTLHAFSVVAFAGEPREFSIASQSLSLPESLVPTDLTIPPSQPTNLTGNIDGAQASLTWTPSTDDETVQGYNVYQNNQYLTTVLEAAYTGPVEPEASYTWSIVAFDVRTNFSQASDSLTLPDTGPIDTTIAPSAPTNLAGSVSGSGSTANATLSWSDATDDRGVAGYNVYRDNQYLTTVFSTSHSVSIDTDNFTNFTVVAFDFDGNFSVNSNDITLPEITDPAALTEPPSQPTNLSGDIQGTAVELNWTASTDNLGVAGYNVYRDNAYITTVFSNTYSGSVEADVFYSFSAIAFDHNGNFSTPSSVLRLPEGGPGPSTEAPTVPQNLTGSLTENGDAFDLSLSWDASTDDESVAGYNVYQNNSYLTTVSTASYESTVADEGPYSYFIVAFDVQSNFSAPSQRLSLPDQDNQAPFFVGFESQTIPAGPVWELIINPQDIDGDIPGLLGGLLPEGMQSDDNFDGTRTLRWQPLQPAIGEHQITMTAFDNADPTISTTRTITLTVVMPDDPSIIPNPGPTIDAVGIYAVRYGDNVVMRVKAVDANGTTPDLQLLNPPAGSTFETFPLDDRVKVLRWTPDASYLGVQSLNFRAIDADDVSLTFDTTVELTVAEPSDYIRPGERLRVLADRIDFKFGYASLLEWYEQPDGDLYADVAASEFNIVSTENSMKWGYINPEQGEYRWEGADNLVSFAQENDMVIHGHPLIWYTVLPPWIINSEVTQRESIMNTFIDTVVQRYDPAVTLWDVVNEAFEDDGTYRNSVWFEAMGAEYINKAFVRARANAPTAKLLYNDYDVGISGAKSDAMYQLMQELIAAGTPIDGVGFQMHVRSDFDQHDEVAVNLQRFADLGLEVYITELDVSMQDGDTEEQQAQVFAGVLSTCLAQPACKATQIWGFTDRYSWLNGADALILDENYQPKPAYQALQGVLGNQ